jgi:peptidoglycan/xylan/chitin deacetylase (PgdA/CDA1 family)
MIIDSVAEIKCHGYAHKGGSQMNEAQQRDVIKKCVELATELTGKNLLDWRLLLYQLWEHTMEVF